MKRSPGLICAMMVLLAATAPQASGAAQAQTAAPDIAVLTGPSDEAGCVTIVGDTVDARVVLDPQDYPVVQLAANLFAEDAQRVTGHRLIVTDSPTGASRLIVVGTLGRSGDESENGPVRNQGVQDNYVRTRVPLPALDAGKHTLTIRAMDPGVVIDRIALP